MNILSWLGTLVGSVAFSPWTQWWNQGTGPQPMPQGMPPMDFTQLTQAQLLASFSDAIGPNGITPRSLRNFVASVVSSNPGVAPVAPILLPGWTTATRPNGSSLPGPAVGYNYTLRQLDMWDNEAQEWVNPVFTGGLVNGPVTFGSSVSFTQPVGFNSTVGFLNQVNLGANVFVQGIPTSCPVNSNGRLWSNARSMSIAP